MTPEDIKTWTLIGLALWNSGLTLVVWLRKPGEEAGAAVERLRQDAANELSQVNTRLTAVETEIRHMPTSEELAELEGTVKQINERTAAQSEQIKGVAAAVQRIEHYLLNSK